VADSRRHREIDEIWCLGDVVGYGPDPGECIDFVRNSVAVCVAGNHDLAASGAIDTLSFNPYAAKAIAWTRQHLTEVDRQYLANLPRRLEDGEFTIVHGSPREPVWEYVLSREFAGENFAAFRTAGCLVGHTHVPAAFAETAPFARTLRLEEGSPLALGGRRAILNPGSVGQPRDGDPRAGYAIIDTEKHLFTLRRVAYDIEIVQSRMRAQGLPHILIERLATGT
jgi:diadenosine tetraphosphatase ApaH/serine/threonine PP2A family protein phosphatase